MYQGNSSFGKQSIQAGEVAQQIVGGQAAQGEAGLNSSFLQMSNVLESNNVFMALDNYQLLKGDSSRRLPELEPIPSDLVLAILQETKSNHSPRWPDVGVLTTIVNRPIFLCSYVINDPGLLESLCQGTYFPISPPSLGHVTAMHGLLYCLLKEFIALQHPLSRKYDLAVSLATCGKNFAAGVETYDIMVVPCFENVLSLTLGVSATLEI